MIYHNNPMKLFKYSIAAILIMSTFACAELFSGGQTAITVSFSNQTQIDICEIYISSEKANDWGENKLPDSDTLPPGGEKTFNVKRGTYDILARACTKEALYSYHGVAKDFTAVIGGPGEVPFRAANTGKIEICFIYIIPAGTAAWGEDQLGGVESILPGESRLFFVNPGFYNLRADDCNKNVISEVENFDLVAGSEWSIYP
jgi:hypothetical protein